MRGLSGRILRARAVIPSASGYTCSGAWSLRKVYPGYSGPCMRVRRGSDAAEQDFGFSGTAIDSAAILSWLGGSAGTIVTWNDQSGNGRHLVNLRTGQPLLVWSGATISHISMEANAALLDIPRSVFGASGSSIASVQTRENVTAAWNVGSDTLRNHVPWTNGYIYISFCSTARHVILEYDLLSAIANGAWMSLTAGCGAAGMSVEVNAGPAATLSATYTSTPSRAVVGNSDSIASPWDALQQSSALREVLIWASDAPSLRLAAVADQRAYWGY